MKIAYITTFDSLDIHAWSGTATYILRALQNSGFQTEIIGNLRDKYPFLWKIKKALYGSMLSKTYLREREPTLLKNYAAQVETALASMDCDVVFSPGTIPIAYLRTEKPIVFWADATFAGMIDFYPDFSNLCAETSKMGTRLSS